MRPIVMEALVPSFSSVCRVQSRPANRVKQPKLNSGSFFGGCGDVRHMCNDGNTLERVADAAAPSVRRLATRALHTYCSEYVPSHVGRCGIPGGYEAFRRISGWPTEDRISCGAQGAARIVGITEPASSRKRGITSFASNPFFRHRDAVLRTTQGARRHVDAICLDVCADLLLAPPAPVALAQSGRVRLRTGMSAATVLATPAPCQHRHQK